MFVDQTVHECLWTVHEHFVTVEPQRPGVVRWPYSLFREIFHAIWVVWGNAKFGAKFGALSQNLGISWSSRAVFTQNLSFFGKFWLSFVKILPTREFFGQEMQNLGRNLGNI